MMHAYAPALISLKSASLFTVHSQLLMQTKHILLPLPIESIQPVTEVIKKNIYETRQ